MGSLTGSVSMGAVGTTSITGLFLAGSAASASLSLFGAAAAGSCSPGGGLISCCGAGAACC
eukprot:6938121-Pyramimonas_sp.AAC.1